MLLFYHFVLFLTLYCELTTMFRFYHLYRITAMLALNDTIARKNSTVRGPPEKLITFADNGLVITVPVDFSEIWRNESRWLFHRLYVYISQNVSKKQHHASLHDCSRTGHTRNSLFQIPESHVYSLLNIVCSMSTTISKLASNSHLTSHLRNGCGKISKKVCKIRARSMP